MLARKYYNSATGSEGLLFLVYDVKDAILVLVPLVNGLHALL
jgi:hypothetical protein